MTLTVGSSSALFQPLFASKILTEEPEYQWAEENSNVRIHLEFKGI